MKKAKLKFRLTVFVLLSTFFVHCSSYKNLDKENLGNQYSLDNVLTARYVVQHLDSLTTIIYYQFNFDDFKYIFNEDSSRSYARYQLKYDLYTDLKASEIVDSTSVIFIDSTNYNKHNSAIGYFELQIPRGTSNYLRIELSDLNSGAEIVQILFIDKSNPYNRQNFVLLDKDDLPMMNPSILKNHPYRLVYNNINLKNVHVRYFKSFLKPANPPMDNDFQKKDLLIKSDSSFEITLNAGISEPLIFNKQGIYHFIADSSTNVGFTVTVFTEGYPWISTPMQLSAPMRYITSNSEYNDIMKSKNKKAAVELFWQRTSSSSQRADEKFNLYFNRVQTANKLFSSDREGWLTDRGMIFIVFGPPARVFRNEGLETWNYLGLNGSQGLSFNFYKIESPLTDNDFRLDRSPNYTNAWNSAVGFWRR